jgi:hypothetical protein
MLLKALSFAKNTFPNCTLISKPKAIETAMNVDSFLRPLLFFMIAFLKND